MAVEVLDQPIPPHLIKEAHCSNCGATLRYLPVDVKPYKSTDYTGCTDIGYEITCPRCHKHVPVPRPK